jgi:hypothetical protein
MAAVSESSLVKAQVKAQPPSPTTKSHHHYQQQQQNEKQLHNLLQQTSSMHQNGSNLVKSPKSSNNGVPYHFLQQHLQHLASENMPPVPVKGSPNGKGHNSRTKMSASDHVIPSNGSVEVKLEGTNKAVTSSQNTTTSRQDDKKLNNNSVSYTAGGRLKFFKGKIF